MPYFKTCPLCGAALDPGEICDCQDKEEAALGAANTEGGKVERELTEPHSTVIIQQGKGKVQA